MRNALRLNTIVERDRMIAAGGMLGLIALAWAYLVLVMPQPLAVAMPDLSHWGFQHFVMAVAMWTVMMVAMMLPSVGPWVAALSTIGGGAGMTRELSAGEFLVGYLLVWTGYSVAAASAQWGLHEAGWLSSASVLDAWPAGFLLIATGVFQWTPAKAACLEHCRSPIGFFLTSWRSGRSGPFRMGVQHGVFCVACCWALMALSFVAGIMNLIWMVFVTLFVLVDHAVARGLWLGRATGAGLVAWGAWLLML
ncbi:MAG: hypothetical protein CL472_10880 [Acidobacteria bacterium]|nr:hypothetical protein [Acidobacteriota bacterium]